MWRRIKAWLNKGNDSRFIVWYCEIPDFLQKKCNEKSVKYVSEVLNINKTIISNIKNEYKYAGHKFCDRLEEKYDVLVTERPKTLKDVYATTNI